ncbi:MAG: bifunctional nicotinamidase/pyrazinamidase [Verrucomicrobiota bacterium]
MKTLILIDIQNDFLPGGALAVPEGDLIVPVVNALMPEFDLVVATQDWHPADHGSFAANHPGQAVYGQGELNGLPQTFWPVHCVRNTGGALFAPGLETRRIARVFPKGLNAEIDSYSGFFDNGHRASTGMAEWLREAGASELWIAGLATDYCVKFTVLDALREGFPVKVVAEACRGVELTAGDCARAFEEMRAAGAVVL